MVRNHNGKIERNKRTENKKYTQDFYRGASKGKLNGKTHSFLRSAIWSGRRVKLSTSQRSFLMSLYSLKLTRLLTTLGLSMGSWRAFSRLAHLPSHVDLCTSLAVGLRLGSVTRSFLMKSRASELTWAECGVRA